MLIRTVTAPGNGQRYDLKGYNLDKVIRHLYLYVDRNAIRMSGMQYCKALLINIGAQTGKKDSSMIYAGTTNTQNNAIIKLNCYMFDAFFPTKLFEWGIPQAVEHATFTLNEAYGTESINNFDTRRRYRWGNPGLYNKIVNTADEYAYTPYAVLENPPPIPRPKYYSIYQQEKEEHEACGIANMGIIQVFEGHELVDSSTQLELRDASEWDTMTAQAKIKAGIPYEMPSQANMILAGLFTPAVESILDGFIFSYDTNTILGWDKKGRAEHASFRNRDDNNPGLGIPMLGLRVESGVYEDCERIKDDLEMFGKRLEAKYGSVRLYYTPLFAGDKLKIVAYDYAPHNQPKELQLKSREPVSCDRGYQVTETLAMLTARATPSIGDDGEED